MSHSPSQRVQTWSTDTVPQTQRVEYFEEACATAIIPFRVVSAADRANFHASIEAVDMGGLSLMRHCGGVQTVRSGKLEIAQQRDGCFNVLASRKGSWRLAHRCEQGFGRDVATFTDSRMPITLETLEEYDFVNIQLPADWVRQWLPDPHIILSRPFTSQTPWGRALTSFMTALTPESVAGRPLPPHLLADHLGSLMALAAAEVDPDGSTKPPRDAVLSQRIEDCIRQRCSEFSLTAADVASALNISPRTLHRHLANGGKTFGSLLIVTRVAVAARMLESRLFSRLTTEQIGRRAGFTDPSHFSRAFSRTIGQSPFKYRRSI